MAPQTNIAVRVPISLLDNKWHTLQFIYQFGSLNLMIDKDTVMIANASYNHKLLTDQEIKNDGAVLILGKMYSGCLLHGPGLVFNKSAMSTVGVLFGSCPLARGQCQDHDVLVREPIDHCQNFPCMQHGQCISIPDDYHCICTARYSGKNCENDAGPPCLSTPCKHGGTCTELARGDFKCHCGPGFTGKLYLIPYQFWGYL